MIRRFRSEDAADVAAVHRAAFAAPDAAGHDRSDEAPEVALVQRLHAAEDTLPHLSLVAEVDGVVVGHAIASRGWVVGQDGRSPALGVGPVGVRPDLQGQGVGSALMHGLAGAMQAADETLACLLGEPGFYARFGYVPADALGIDAPDAAWGRYFQARRLSTATPTGAFSYHRAFAALGSDDEGTPASRPPPPAPVPDRGRPPTLRQARASDAAALTALDVAGFDPTTTPAEEPPTRSAPFFDRVGPDGHIVAVDDEDTPIAYVRMARPTSLAASDHVLAIHGLAVHPDHRGRGLGPALMHAAMAHGRAAGKRKISLRVLGGNVRAQRLYASLGFVVEGRLREEFVVAGQPVDDLIMSRPL